MPLTPADHTFITSLLAPEEILQPHDPRFKSHTLPWSLSYDLHPPLALTPSTTPTLSHLIRYLYTSPHHFTIRGRGIGSASAPDIIISMRNFTSLTFDALNSSVDIGAGLDWGEVDARLATLAPGFVVVGARCPYVGVVGSTLAGGLSWLSHELGLGSDPGNLLDAEVVLHDGRVVWASSEPELMWGLRGGGGNFGVVTTLRVRAHAAPREIFAGMLMFSAGVLGVMSRKLSWWVGNFADEKTALHVFVFDFSGRELHGEKEPTIAALIYDAKGEEHARGSDEGFKWLFEMEGVQEMDVGYKTLAQVHELQRSQEKSHGTSRSWLQAALVGDEDVDEHFLERVWDWYHSVGREAPELSLGTFALFEVMQRPAFESSGGRDQTAWPHGGKGRQHVMQMSVGGGPPGVEDDSAKMEKLRALALDVMKRGPAAITNKKQHPPGDFLPNFLLENHDMSAVFAENWDRVRAVKRRYDPKGKFGTGPGGFIAPVEESLPNGHAKEKSDTTCGLTRFAEDLAASRS